MENKKKLGWKAGCMVVMVGALLIMSLCTSSTMMVLGAAVSSLHLSGGTTTGGTGKTSPVTIICQINCKGKYGTAIAEGALTIADHLYGVPDTYYDAMMPPQALSYWNSVCPDGSGCQIDWEEGNLQCVFLVTGAFALAGHPLPVAHNAIQFWADYADLSGFQEIAAGGGMPAIGDIMVLDDSSIGGVGHVAVVIGVTLPYTDKSGKAHRGIIHFAQANSFQNVSIASINADSSISLDNGIVGANFWPGYTVVGFIRTV